MARRSCRHFVLTALLCCAPKVALAADRAPSLADLTIPADLGYIVDTQPPADPTSPLVVHIQEAHTNYEAQQHIVRILQQLVTRYGLKLVLVEGGSGDVGLADLRGYGPPENRRQVAEKYLKAGLIGAEEYLDITSEAPLTLWGVEDEALYRQDVDAFLAAEPLQASLEPVLASVRDAVGSLRPLLLDPALIELEAKRTAFEQGTLDLAGYLEALSRQADRAGLSLASAPNLARLTALRQTEQTIRLEEVSREQAALVAQLGTLLGEQALTDLLAKARQMKAGAITREAYFAFLKQRAASASISLSAYPSLSRYLRYLEDKSLVQPTALATELREAADRLRDALADRPDSRQLQAIAHQVELMENCVSLRLTSEEYAEFAALPLTGLTDGWQRFLNEQLRQRGLPSRSFEELSRLQEALPVLQRFYELAQRRDQMLIANASAKLRATHEPLAVLITGGFHSDRITQALHDQGMGVVVVAPRLTHPTDERLYHAVLKYKNGQGRLEDVWALANQPTAAAIDPR